jgi:tetratricopeptide (TPR) repeat protein
VRTPLWLVAILSPFFAAAAVWAAVPGTRHEATAPAPLRILQLDSLEGLDSKERAAVFSEYVAAVRAARAAGDQARSLELAERATRLYPALRRPWLHVAAARLALEKWGPAIEAARRGASSQDDAFPPPALPEETAPGAAYWEGLALFRTQRYDEALTLLQSAVTRAPGWAEASRALGEAEFVAGHSAPALAAYTKAFELDPHTGTAQDLGYLAEARATAGDLDGGIAALQEALVRSPYTPGLHAKLGDLLRRQGQLAEAYYELVLEALVQGVQGPFSSPAVNMADRIVKQVRDDTTSAYRHELLVVASALSSLEAGDVHRSIHQIAHALSISHSTSLVPRFLLADAYSRDGKPEKAREQLQQILQLQPDFAPALYALSDAETKLGLPKDAERDRERARTLFPGYWKFHASAARP